MCCVSAPDFGGKYAGVVRSPTVLCSDVLLRRWMDVFVIHRVKIALLSLHGSACSWALALRLPLISSLFSSCFPASAPHCTALSEIPQLAKKWSSCRGWGLSDSFESSALLQLMPLVLVHGVWAC